MNTYPTPPTHLLPTPTLPPTQVALVTGATSGVGLETARELARKKCHVVLAGRSTEKLERRAKFN